MERRGEPTSDQRLPFHPPNTPQYTALPVPQVTYPHSATTDSTVQPRKVSQAQTAAAPQTYSVSKPSSPHSPETQYPHPRHCPPYNHSPARSHYRSVSATCAWEQVEPPREAALYRLRPQGAGDTMGRGTSSSVGRRLRYSCRRRGRRRLRRREGRWIEIGLTRRVSLFWRGGSLGWSCESEIELEGRGLEEEEVKVRRPLCIKLECPLL
jgi:hypothetical protein